MCQHVYNHLASKSKFTGKEGIVEWNQEMDLLQAGIMVDWEEGSIKERFQSTVQALAKIYHNDEQIHMKNMYIYIIVGSESTHEHTDSHWGNRIAAMANVRLTLVRFSFDGVQDGIPVVGGVM
ncbi:hypothetical protein ACJX0J_031264 [Zea mays]